MFSERVRLFLADIIEDSDLVTGYLHGMTAQALIDDQKTLLAVERLFQRITEAVIQIGPLDMAHVDATLPVNNIRALGNRLRHDYRNIDPSILLMTAEKELPALRRAAARALEP